MKLSCHAALTYSLMLLLLLLHDFSFGNLTVADCDVQFPFVDFPWYLFRFRVRGLELLKFLGLKVFRV